MKLKLYKKNQWKSKKQLTTLFFFLVLILSISVESTNAQYVHASGNKIVDNNGNEISFTGINLGNWLLWEGYLMMGDFNYRTHTQFFDGVKKAFGNNLTKALEFEHQWRLNYITEKAIKDLKDLGFNSVRVPFHFNMFWDWNSNSTSDHGFQYIDKLIDYCRTHGVYVLLDMHAAPGYQNPGDHSDNNDSKAPTIEYQNTVKFWQGDNVNIASKVWKHIASHYKNEPVVWGYGLINEPVPSESEKYGLLASMVTMRNAIRQVDNNHIIVAEGSWWGSDMEPLDWTNSQVNSQSGISSRWDDNLVYETHHYSHDVSLLESRLAVCNRLNIPMILGEYGESDMGNLRNMTNWCIDNNVGYFPWSFKKMSHDKCLWTITPNSAYNTLKDAINSNSTGPSDLYDNMLSFAKNNIKNGHSSITWHQSFYDAVKNNSTPTITCDDAAAQPIPGKIQAEDYCKMNGIQLENTSDAGGGQNVGYVDNGDWLDFRVNVASAGTYTVKFRVASGSTGSKSIQLKNGSTNLGTATFTATGGWQIWKTVSKNYSLSKGVQTLRIHFASSGININWIDFSTSSSCDPTPITPYININGSWSSTTSATVDVGDDISFGPEPISGGSWEWTGPNNFTSSIRTPMISNIQTNQAGTYNATYTNSCGAQSTKQFMVTVADNQFSKKIEAENYFNMRGVQTENTSDVGGGKNVGWLDRNDWMGYTINLPTSGRYTIEYRIASPNGGKLRFESYGGSSNYGSLTVPSTGGWQNWQTISHTVDLPAGNKSYAIFVLESSWNINWFRVTKGDLKSAESSVPVSVKVKLYPNPVHSTLFVANVANNSLIQVYSLSGIKVKENIGTSVDMSELSGGVYVVRVHSEKGTEQLKVIKE